MPVEAFVQTGDRTMFSYLMKPFSDQLMRSFRSGEVVPAVVPANATLRRHHPRRRVIQYSRDGSY